MRFPYTVTAPTQNEFDSLPRLPLTLQLDRRQIEAVGLVDSGATVNVLPLFLGSTRTPVIDRQNLLGRSFSSTKLSLETFPENIGADFDCADHVWTDL